MKFELPQVVFSKVLRAVVEFELIDDGGRFKSGGTVGVTRSRSHQINSRR